MVTSVTRAYVAGSSLSQFKGKSINPLIIIIFGNTHYIFVVKTVQKYELTQSKQNAIYF